MTATLIPAPADTATASGATSGRVAPVLTLMLCSRNDRYMGNSVWRLETTLNYTARSAAAVGRLDALEILVSDWGSDVPLRDVVRLEPAAARCVSFLHTPPALARSLQRDSPFPEVLALNAAARRARGQYIGRIDQDTLVGARFLARFLRWAEGGWPLAVPLSQTLLFANRRSIPYRLAARCPSPWVVEDLIARHGHQLAIETAEVFYWSDVGVWLAHRDLWNACGGYDERMIYMNDMEIDMTGRLMTRYPMVDLGKLVRYDFYHLDHYHPRGSRASSTHRTVNNRFDREDRGFNPSGVQWGLTAHDLRVVPARAVQAPPASRPPACVRRPVLAALFPALQIRRAIDHLVYRTVRTWKQTWSRRSTLAWAAVRRQPLTRWPALLRRLWIERPSARRRAADQGERTR